MGTGLYDAVFAALGKLYGKDARTPITNLTLFGGFATHGVLAAERAAGGELRLARRLPDLRRPASRRLAAAADGGDAAAVGRDGRSRAAIGRRGAPSDSRRQPLAHERLIFVLLALVLTISAGIGSIVIVHLLIFLQARGADFALAVTLGTLFGPAQVGARFIERLFGAHYHPIWTMVASCVLMLIGLVLLLGGFPLLALTILLYGGGYGIMWIARGTLPLALFGPDRYATLMGRLAFPSLIVQALAPSAARC